MNIINILKGHVDTSSMGSFAASLAEVCERFSHTERECENEISRMIAAMAEGQTDAETDRRIQDAVVIQRVIQEANARIRLVLANPKALGMFWFEVSAALPGSTARTLH